ncbi:MAG: hypothetical protein KF773_15505 [Deltaproteobacteria bacterium]|nr:hypothetical protein [Deltaproteobacteria bacterium]
MDGVTGLLIKLGVRLVVFGAVFFIVSRRNPRIIIRNKWATPLIAFVFAFLNTALYWALRPILDVATLGAISFFLPLVLNIVFLVATVRVFASIRDRLAARAPAPALDKKGAKGAQPEAPKSWFEIDGIFATLWMALYLTAAHGALWVALDYLPNR